MDPVCFSFAVIFLSIYISGCLCLPVTYRAMLVDLNMTGPEPHVQSGHLPAGRQVSNHRLQSVTDEEVSFNYKDYRDDGSQKLMTLSNREFVRRFAQHILPHRFVRIRHYGILSSSWKRGKLQTLKQSVHADRPAATIKTMLRKCPCCKTGTLITIDVFGKRGPPQKYFTGTTSAPVA